MMEGAYYEIFGSLEHLTASREVLCRDAAGTHPHPVSSPGFPG